MKVKRGLTNLDVIVKAVSQVTGQPEQCLRQTICTGIEKGNLPPGKLFEKCPNGSEKVRDLVRISLRRFSLGPFKGPLWVIGDLSTFNRRNVQLWVIGH